MGIRNDEYLCIMTGRISVIRFAKYQVFKIQENINIAWEVAKVKIDKTLNFEKLIREDQTMEIKNALTVITEIYNINGSRYFRIQY